ncbi:hypothetical protein PENTCL1PPCAC_26125 [Pristionchus entomophagus]|uniref:Mitochondrial fission factor n=1 Tax=Pristionchus entomophagus TaxID=358040 RepID=A0AAV5UBW0_9BILA|nr:hypothetical protein PENTCL1PPCAC_26125 [Pristionchus entomophagus]
MDTVLLQRMHVPQHISVTGDSTVPSSYDEAGRAWAEKEMIASMMSVPDRIVVAGGDSHTSRRSTPKEMVLDQMLNEIKSDDATLKDLPLNITLNEEPSYPDVVEPVNRHEESMSQASIAIDDNPLQELKLMRRQLTKVCSRLYELEEDLEKRRSRDFFFGSGMLGLTAMVLFLILRR